MSSSEVFYSIAEVQEALEAGRITEAAAARLREVLLREYRPTSVFIDGVEIIPGNGDEVFSGGPAENE